MDDRFIDPETITSTDKLCFMILDHLRRLEDTLDDFKTDYLNIKQTEKYNEIMKCVQEFLNNDVYGDYLIKSDFIDDSYIFMCKEEWNLLAISICIKKLSYDRIKSIWIKNFPYHDIESLLKLWGENGFTEKDHIIYGYNYNSPNLMSELESMKKYSYTTDDVKKLLNTFTLLELINITPIIKTITYKYIPQTKR